MTSHRLVDIRRTALALAQATRTGDRLAQADVLAMLTEDDALEFLAALANMVHLAFAADPRQGWQTFIDSYGASLDQVDAKLQGKTDT